MLLAVDKQNEVKTKWCSEDSYRCGHNRAPPNWKQITDTFVEKEALPKAL